MGNRTVNENKLGSVRIELTLQRGVLDGGDSFCRITVLNRPAARRHSADHSPVNVCARSRLSQYRRLGR